MLDHLRIVVGGQKRLMRAARRHRHVADEVGEPGELRALQLGMLVPVVVDVPGLVGDHEIVAALVDRILEDHEVLDQHLVHAAERLEAMQVVLAGFELDVPRLAGEPRAERMHPLVVRVQKPRHRVLRQPVHLEIGMELAQLARDREIAPPVAEPDRRGEIERALFPCRARRRPAAPARRGRACDRESR